MLSPKGRKPNTKARRREGRQGYVNQPSLLVLNEHAEFQEFNGDTRAPDRIEIE